MKHIYLHCHCLPGRNIAVDLASVVIHTDKNCRPDRVYIMDQELEEPCQTQQTFKGINRNKLSLHPTKKQLGLWEKEMEELRAMLTSDPFQILPVSRHKKDSTRHLSTSAKRKPLKRKALKKKPASLKRQVKKKR